MSGILPSGMSGILPFTSGMSGIAPLMPSALPDSPAAAPAAPAIPAAPAAAAPPEIPEPLIFESPSTVISPASAAALAAASPALPAAAPAAPAAPAAAAVPVAPKPVPEPMAALRFALTVATSHGWFAAPGSKSALLEPSGWLPASLKPAASAADGESNHTSALVCSYPVESGRWYFWESTFPLMG